MKLLKLFINIGVSEDMPNTLKSRVKATNIFILIILCCLIYLLSIFSQMKNTSSLVLTVFIILSLLLPILNYAGLHQIVRLFISFIPCLTTLFYDINAKLSNVENNEVVEIISYISPHFVIATSIAIPLALFLPRERLLLTFSTTLILLISIFFDNIYAFFGASYQDLGLSSKRYNLVQINVYICIIIISSTYLFQLYNNYINEKNNISTLKETQEKNKQLQENEKKLKLSFLEIEERREETNQQKWFNEGLAKFSEMLQSGHQDKEIFQKVISQLIKYLNASQGGIYNIQNLESDESYIELIAFYAFNYQKYKKQVFFMGEGLIGQSAVSKKTIQLTDLPEDYLRIESGLGEALPNHLLIIPLIFNNNVYGILEITSFEIFKFYQIKFLEKLGESIAISLYNQKTQTQTLKLLEETQEKNKIIRVKEDENRLKELNYLEKIKNLEDIVEGLKNKLKNID